MKLSGNNLLYESPLFQVRLESMSRGQRIRLSYQRARAILNTYHLTAEDILQCSNKFWAMQMDPLLPQDIACFTILAAHVLMVGTIAGYVRERPDLYPLLETLLSLDSVGVYLLTERGHGLDAFNIETAAIKTESGFILNTPGEQAAKFMPATTPLGVPKVALVVAKLIIDNIDHGSRTFIVPICNDKEMYTGISSTPLPPRSGTTPLDFSITNFHKVLLPPNSLLGPIDRGSSSVSSRLSWWNEVSRIPIGTFAVAAPLAQAIKQVAYIGGMYSFRRKIGGKKKESFPIISFRTQQWLVLQALAVSAVLEAWYPNAAQQLSDPKVDRRIKHGISVIFKATVCRHFQVCVHQMMERCGAQGTFEHNWMSRVEADARGIIIAEGDVLTLCIRLFSELILGRYAIPLPDSDALLVKHAKSILEDNSVLASKLPDGHRGESFNSLILPQAEAGITAIGHALAYSAGRVEGVPEPFLKLYECAVMRLDPTWYSEKEGISAQEQHVREHHTISNALPSLEKDISSLGVEKYVSAPIVNEERWLAWLAELPSFEGKAQPMLFNSSPTMTHL